MCIFSCGEKKESERERRLLKGEAIFGFYLFKQREEGRRGGKASLKKRLRLGTHPNFFEHFIWVSSNPNLYKCEFNCFSLVYGCFEVV